MPTPKAKKAAPKKTAVKKPVAKKAAPLKRIPVGARVEFWSDAGLTRAQAEVFGLPIHSGIVAALPGTISATPNCYRVTVDKTPGGKTRLVTKPMFPYAKRLEEQNASKLRIVK